MPRASLKHRKDGRYKVVYKGMVFMGNTQSEAYAKRNEYKKLLEAGLRADAAGVTVAQYAHQWMLTYKSNIGIRTQNEHIRELNTLIQMIGNKPLKDVVPSDIQAVYNRRAGKSASYIRHLAQTVDALFAAAVADRLITHSPCMSIKPPKGKAGTHRAIEEWERELILSSNHRFTPAALCMLYAGLRRGEVLAMNVDRDVNFNAQTIIVREAIRFEDNQPLIVKPKTEAGIRTIPMVNVLSNTLLNIQGLVAPSTCGTTMSETAFSRAWAGFINHLEELLNHDSKRWYGHRKDQGEAWLDAHPWHTVKITPHDLRHSYCTMLYDAGVDLKTAQKWMGHADQAVTLRIYTHLTAEREAEAAQKLREKVNAKFGCKVQNEVQPLLVRVK